MVNEEISREPGSYIVILHSSTNETVNIGARGPLQLMPGFYLYTGSALGPGGLRARLGHHLSVSQRPRWHIDYLRRVTEVWEAWLYIGDDRKEHHWANALANTPGLAPVVPGFGASDCSCVTHLFYTQSEPTIADFNRSLKRLGLAANAFPLRKKM